MSLIHRARRPLLILHALAGDLLMAVPALRALQSRFGCDFPVICGTEPEHLNIFRAVGFSNIRQTEFATRDPLPGEIIVTPCEWRFDVSLVLPHTTNCDLLINLTDSCGPAFDELARQCALPSVGYHTSADRRVDDRPAPGHAVLHMIERYFAVVHALLPDAYLTDHAYFPHRDDVEQIREIVRSDIGPHRLIALHADTKVFKMWPLERWAEWLKRLWSDEPDTRVVLLGYPAIAIENYGVDSRLHDCRDLPLTVNYEIAAMADLFIGIDSCMLHAADLCRVPSVGVFTKDYPPDTAGLYFADGICLVGSNPPTDVEIDDVWRAYCQVRDRQRR